MAKTSKDAYRHIQAWSGFFKDMRWIAEKEIELFLEKRKKKQYLKQSLERLKKRGFLSEKNASLIPTDKGMKFFRKQNFLVAHYENLKNWDGKWRLISFDIPINENKKRNQLRALLQEFDFKPLHKSVWVSPYKSTELFWQLLVDYEIEKHCKIMTVEIIEGGEGLKSQFKLK